MRSSVRSLLIVFALLFSQHAAMLHGLTHAKHDVALAVHHDGKVPALDHGTDVCAAFGVLGHALGNAVTAQFCAGERAGTPLAAFDVLRAVTRIVFDSRAPPLSG